MRLWHEELLSKLPRQQLLGQHRECTALIGLGWTKKHRTVQYALNDNLERLKAYHLRVIDEMERRGYKVSREWYNPLYRGKILGMDHNINPVKTLTIYLTDGNIYKQHDRKYLTECLENLRMKGVEI